MAVDAGLAVQVTLFVLATLLHFLRSFLDLLSPRVVSRASTFWASIGTLCYAAVFALELWRLNHGGGGWGAVKAQGFLAPSALWAMKVSAASLYPQLGVRLLVVGVLAAYLATSFVALLLVFVFVCRPWRAVVAGMGYCVGETEVVTYTVLNVIGYIFVMAVPICIWTSINHRHRQPVAALLVLATGLCVISIVHGVLTLDLATYQPALIPDVLVGVELSLALMTTSLPSLWLHYLYRHHLPHRSTTTNSLSEPTKPPQTAGEERELVTLGIGFDPRHLGVLPDSIRSFRSGASTPIGGGTRMVQTEDWRDEGRGEVDDWRDEGGRGGDAGGYGGQEGELAVISSEIWEVDLEASPRSPKSMGGG